MKQRRSTPEFSISFLDVICCGFGAVILLLMITKTVEPQILERSTIKAEALVAELTRQLFKIRGDTTVLNRSLTAKKEQISKYEDQIALLQSTLASTRSMFDELETTNNAAREIQDELNRALQTLTEEEQRLLGEDYELKNQLIGGIPVDSEYIVFVIDSSGSMQRMWPRVLREVINTLEIYPEVKGIQIVNGRFAHLIPSSVGTWLENSKRETLIIPNLKNWNAFDDSTLVDGIANAVRYYGGRAEQVSIYVFADDLAPASRFSSYARADYVGVLKEIRKQNRVLGGDDLKTRIHFVAFPLAEPGWITLPGVPQKQADFINFARKLTHQNNGTLVALMN